MKSTLDIAKDFVKKLKHMTSRGQDEYPFWYLYSSEFLALDIILRNYEDFIINKKDI